MPLIRRSTAVVALLVAIIAPVVWLGPGAQADEAGPVQIAEAPALEWGFKQSWMIYAGVPEAGGGATVSLGGGLYDLGWEFESGSYDASTGTTELRYAGTVHWRKYYLPDNPGLSSPPPGYSGPLDIHLLDVTLSDPIITIGRDAAAISVEAVSRDLDTWELVDTGRVDVVNLDPAGVTPLVSGGMTTWSGIPAASADGANSVFASNYQPGLAVDAVGFSYTGPGGAPDFSEEWDLPGSTKLNLAQSSILTTIGNENQYSPWWIDRGRRLIHYRTSSVVDGQTFWTYRAFSLDTMADVGEPLVLPNAERVSQTTVFDGNSGRLFYRRSGETPTTRWIKFDTEQAKYALGTSASAIPIVGGQTLAWDAIGQRAFNIRRFVPAGVTSTDYDNHKWQLNLYKEQPDGTWSIETIDLPGFGPGLNRRGYTESSGLATSTGLAAPDGSLIVLGTQRTSSAPNVPAPITVPGALRISLAGGQATVTPVAGTEVGNASSSSLFDMLAPGPGGQVALFRDGAAGIPNIVQTLTVPEGGGAATAGPQVDFGDVDLGPIGDSMFAVDSQDGTIWIGGYQSQRIVGVADGRVVADQYFQQRHPRGGPVVVGADHAVYAQTNDGSPAGFGGSPIYGFGKFERLGWSPGVTGDPDPVAAELAVGEASEKVQFHSVATGDPAPERQWQVKAPGTSRFVDLEGESSETLTVDAERGMGGSQYRAVYSNTAGRIASDPAPLSVAYAPQIAVDVADVSVAEGEEAVFQALPQGSPEPDVVWQRRVGGFWQAIDPDDDNFDVDGGTLTVKETNLEQSEALFRVRAANDVGTVYSRAAKLMVTPGGGIPPGGLSLDGVSLDWTGSGELQRMAPNGQPNYFSADVSDGSEATYGATSSGVRVLHVPAVGTPTAASWATRGAQTGGGVEQVVRLTDGHAEIEEDGSTVVTWDGSFSVNFYGGLVPFTVSSPELTVDGDGDGALRADLSGYGASMANPSDRHPVAPVADVTIATFSGVEVDPTRVIEIEPDYAGVEVDASAGFVPQDRVSTGWGAWPQALVDFHGETGLAPYWYSSGGAFDPHKAAEPFTVDFTGAGSVPPLVPDSPAPPAENPPRPGGERWTKTTPRVTFAIRRHRGVVKLAVRARIPGAKGVYPTGQLVVRDSGRIVAVRGLRAKHKGRTVVRLPKLRRGVHFLRVGLAANSRQRTATTAYRTRKVR
jgi:hypothetical protein